jgi:O-antigen/teichoic acid export membrane protein
LPAGAFGRAAVTGAAWLSAATLANGVIGAVVNIILARRLGPLPIGAYALAVAASDLAALLVTWGVDTYLVQSPEDDAEQFGTALSFVLLLGGGFLVLTAAIIPFFLWRQQPLVAALLAGLAVQRLLLLNGSCYSAVLQRRFQFGWLALIQIGTGIVEHIVAVVVAIAGGGVLALLARDVLDAVGQLVGGRLISKRRYRPQWRPVVAARIRRFGIAVLLSQSGELATHKLDSALLGVVWGTRELAFYEEAYKLANVALRISQPALSQVALPAYARLREDADRRSAVFHTIQSGGFYALVPFFLMLLLLPEALIRLLFGAQWLGAVPMLRAFAGYALLAPLFEHLRQLLFAEGMAGAVARAKLVQLAVFLPVVAALLARWGGAGTAVAVDAGVLAALIAAGFAARRLLTGQSAFLRTYGPALLAGLVAATATAVVAPLSAAPVRFVILLVSYGVVLLGCLQGRLGRVLTRFR